MFRFACMAAFALAGSSVAHAGIDLHGADCGLHSDYSMAIKQDALVFTRSGGPAAEIVIAHGTLRVDGREIELGAADRERVLGIEHGVRDVLPQVREIAHDAIQIAFDAVTEVSGAFAKDAETARASAQRLARVSADVHRRIDAKRERDGLGARALNLDRLFRHDGQAFEARRGDDVAMRRFVGVHDLEAVDVLDQPFARFARERGAVADHVDLEGAAQVQAHAEHGGQRE